MRPTSSGSKVRIRPEALEDCELETIACATTAAIGCQSWAICWDLAVLGWTAIDPCASCVGLARMRLGGAAPATGSHVANRARLATADELDALLSQARAALPASNTS